MGVAELLDVGQFVVQEPPYQPVQFSLSGHVHPQGYIAVLHQHRRLRVLEDDVVPGVAPVELRLNLSVQVVVAILGPPIAPGHPKRVLDRAIRDHVANCLQLGNEHQPFLVLPAVGVQAVLEGRPDVQLVVGATELDQFLPPSVVGFYVRVIRHLVFTIPKSGCRRNLERLVRDCSDTMRRVPGSGSSHFDTDRTISSTSTAPLWADKSAVALCPKSRPLF